MLLRAAKARVSHRRCSIGFSAIKFHTGRRADGSNLIVVTEARLVEISLVPSGAFPSTSVEFL